MIWTEELIKSIEQWDNDVPEKNMSIKDVCFMIGYPLGLDSNQENWTTDFIRERIRHLVEKEGLSEKFLVEALILEMTNFLTRLVDTLGESIINNEGMVRVFEENGYTDNNHPKEKLEELKTMRYIYKAEDAIDAWNKIISVNFSRAKKRELDDIEFAKHSSEMKKFIDSIPEEDRHKPMKELLGE